MEHSLENIHVLDASKGVAGAFCAKLLSDGGAHVVRVEFGSGDPVRKWQPICYDDTHRTAVLFHFLRCNNEVFHLGEASRSSSDVLRQLVSRSDIVIRSKDDGLEDLGTLISRTPSLIVATLTGGDDGDNPWADDLLSYARTGAASINGRVGRAPLKGSGHQASFLAGAAACTGCLALVHRRRRTGRGGSLEVAVADSLLCAYAPSVLSTQYTGRPPVQRTGGFPTGPIHARDGDVVLTVSRAHFWRDAMNALGLVELAGSEPFYDPLYRQEHYADVAPLVEERVGEWSKDELFRVLSDLRVTIGKVMSVEELCDDVHLRAREFVNESTGVIGPPFKMSKSAIIPTNPQDVIAAHEEHVGDRE